MIASSGWSSLRYVFSKYWYSNFSLWSKLQTITSWELSATHFLWTWPDTLSSDLTRHTSFGPDPTHFLWTWPDTLPLDLARHTSFGPGPTHFLRTWSDTLPSFGPDPTHFLWTWPTHFLWTWPDTLPLDLARHTSILWTWPDTLPLDLTRHIFHPTRDFPFKSRTQTNPIYFKQLIAYVIWNFFRPIQPADFSSKLPYPIRSADNRE